MDMERTRDSPDTTSTRWLSAAYQIGIVLASGAVITGMLVLAYLAGGLGLVGLVFTGIGYFAPHAVHLF